VCDYNVMHTLKNYCMFILVGKPVFKKTVKLTLTINATDDAITHSNGDIQQTIPETYTVTFVHIAG